MNRGYDPESYLAGGPEPERAGPNAGRRTDSKTEVYQVAAGLLRQDRGRLWALYLILLIPLLVGHIFPQAQLHQPQLFKISKMLCMLSVLFVTGSRWINRLRPVPAGWRWKSYALLLLCGLALWLPPAFLMSALFSEPAASPGMDLICLLLLALSVGLLFRYYFYFLPLLLEERSLRAVAATARAFTAADPWLTMRVLAAPFAVEWLAASILQTPSPDGRILIVAQLVAACDGLFWLLSIYLGLACGLVLLDDRSWRAGRLDPYRAPRLATLAAQGSAWLAQALRPKNGVKMMLVAALIGLGNLAAMMATAPAPSFQVDAMKIDGQNLILDLSLRDERYLFRGFNPQFLRLAGEAPSESVAPVPSQIFVDDEPLSPAVFQIPERAPSVRLRLEFRTNRSTQGLKDLEDLHLWYLGSRVMRLEMKSAEIIAGPTP
jgi:hypothetical protein